MTSYKDLAAPLLENGITIFHTLTRPLLESRQSQAMERPTVYDNAGKCLVLGMCSINAGGQQPHGDLPIYVKTIFAKVFFSFLLYFFFCFNET